MRRKEEGRRRYVRPLGVASCWLEARPRAGLVGEEGRRVVGSPDS